MSHKKQNTALESITNRPGRRSRAESTRRWLLCSSYPHAVFANIGIMILRAIGEEDLDVHAQGIKAQEKMFDMLDFIRYVDIERISDKLTITVKRLILERGTTTIEDSRESHEHMVTLNIDLDPQMRIENSDTLVEYLIEQFYQVAAPGRGKQDPWYRQTWIAETKRLRGPETSRDFRDLTVRSQREKIAVENVRAALTESLSRENFHIALSTSNICCLDQSLRMRPETVPTTRRR